MEFLQRLLPALHRDYFPYAFRYFPGVAPGIIHRIALDINHGIPPEIATGITLEILQMIHPGFLLRIASKIFLGFIQDVSTDSLRVFYPRWLQKNRSEISPEILLEITSRTPLEISRSSWDGFHTFSRSYS